MTAQNALAFPGLLMRSLGPALLSWSERRRVPAFGGFLPTDIAGLVGWYDPSDLSTMFQDDLGKVPVTAAGDPVALMLDTSKGLALGPELVVNGDFSTGDLTGWTDTTTGGDWSVVDGKAVDAGTSAGDLQQTVATEVGAFYQVEFTQSDISNGNPSFKFAGQNITTAQSAPGTYKAIVRAASTSAPVATSGQLALWSVDNVSVRKVAGNHLVQVTAAARPTYQTDGTLHWLQFDGVDDVLVGPVVDTGGATSMALGAAFITDAFGSISAGVFGDAEYQDGGIMIAVGSSEVAVISNDDGAEYRTYFSPVSLGATYVALGYTGVGAFHYRTGKDEQARPDDSTSSPVMELLLGKGTQGGRTGNFNGKVFSAVYAVSDEAQARALIHYLNKKAGLA